jgi:HNH endonuclease
MMKNLTCFICRTQLFGTINQKYCGPTCREKADRESFRISWFNNDSRSKGLPSSLTLKQWLVTLNHFGWACAYCQKPYKGLDHFIPTTLGGGTTVSNCVPCCENCNNIKGWQHPNDIREIPQEAIEHVRTFLASMS